VESAADLGARAERLVREGQLEAAVPVLEEAVGAARAGERPLYERALADALLALGADESAASLYRALIDGRKAPPSPALHGNLAVAYLRQGDYGRARSEAEAALRIYPQHAEANKTLGLADLREGKSASAAARLEAALALKPDLPEAEAGLAEIAEAAGDGREALRRYRKLRAGLEDNRATDFHRRWRNLFLPERRDAAAVLDERIRRLEGTAGTAGTARG
jgi:tetratricopeptide (TPR) repeat protein